MHTQALKGYTPTTLKKHLTHRQRTGLNVRYCRNDGHVLDDELPDRTTARQPTLIEHGNKDKIHPRDVVEHSACLYGQHS